MKLTRFLKEKCMNTGINNFDPIDENRCPVCGYPKVIESGLEVCYRCGWSEEDKYEGYYDE